MVSVSRWAAVFKRLLDAEVFRPSVEVGALALRKRCLIDESWDSISKAAFKRTAAAEYSISDCCIDALRTASSVSAPSAMLESMDAIAKMALGPHSHSLCSRDA